MRGPNGSGSHKTGDRAFDAAYRVVSADATTQNAFLSAEVRHALLDLLATHEHVHVTTDGIAVVTRAMLSPDGFAQVLRPLAEIEKMIKRATHG